MLFKIGGRIPPQRTHQHKRLLRHKESPKKFSISPRRFSQWPMHWFPWAASSSCPLTTGVAPRAATGEGCRDNPLDTWHGVSPTPTAKHTGLWRAHVENISNSKRNYSSMHERKRLKWSLYDYFYLQSFTRTPAHTLLRHQPKHDFRRSLNLWIQRVRTLSCLTGGSEPTHCNKCKVPSKSLYSWCLRNRSWTRTASTLLHLPDALGNSADPFLSPQSVNGCWLPSSCFDCCWDPPSITRVRSIVLVTYCIQVTWSIQ